MRKAIALPGVPKILGSAGISSIPKAAIAVFVGTEFDSLDGCGGDDGTPLRKTLKLVESMIRKAGTSDRTFKSALIFAIADSDSTLREEARKVLAWEDIRDQEYDKQITLDLIQWQATGGTIDTDGVLQAGDDEGNFTVTYASHALADSSGNGKTFIPMRA